MKTRQPDTRWRGRIAALVSAAMLSFALASCGGGSDGGDGGIVGTGIQLRGTTSDQRLYATNTIQYKRASGEEGSVVVGNNGRFSADDIEGTGPLLLRADLGNNDYLYGIGFPDSDNLIQQNVHDYTDLVVRNWYASRGLDINSAFEAAGSLANVPTAAEIDETSQAVLAIVADVLADYGIAGVDPLTADYVAGSNGIGRFLDANPVLINNGTINIFISDPATDTQSVATSNVSIGTDLAATDNTPPTSPTDLRPFANSGEIVLVWTPSNDNIGVSTYQVLRDGEMLASTPYPFYIDETLTANSAASYIIIAVDAAGNESEETAEVSITNDSTPDTTAPPAPVALALSPSNDNIMLTWSQSNIADVAAFNVYKGSGGSAPTQLARVSATFMTDADVEAGSEFCYRVTAVDAAGNESVSTDVVCATTTGTSVTTNTVTPGGDVTIAFASTSYQVVEDASSVSILVSRSGSSAGSVSVDYSVSSGTAIAGEDFTATSGTLTWADGDTNDKRITVQVAADTVAESDETFTVTLSNASSNSSIEDATATVTINNRESVECATELENTSISENTVLDLPCYIVPRTISVADGVTLTIDAGTRLEFAAGTGINVNGALTAQGTATDPIVLTGREKTEGYWDGVQFFFTNSGANLLEHVTVEYGGTSGNGDANIWARSNSSSPTRLSMDSVTLRHSLGDGLNFDGSMTIGSFTENVITANARAGTIHVDVTSAIDASNSFSGNTSDILVIKSGSLQRDGRFAAIDIDWLVDTTVDIDSGSTLTIEPGASILFADSTGIVVDQSANLVAIGTAEDPIVMQAQTASPGRWKGIQYFFQTGLDNRLEHVTLRHAGGTGNGSSAVWVRSNTSSPATLGLNNINISESAGSGITAENGTVFTEFDNVTVSNSGSGAVLHADVVGQIGSGNSFVGNTEPVVAVSAGTISKAASWPALDVPYLTENISINSVLTLEPGVNIWGNSGTLLTIGRDGALNASGTMTNPIVLRGALEQAGYWRGLQYFFTSSFQNVLDNVILQHGGGGSAPAAVHMRCNTSSPGQLTISNSAIELSGSYGIQVDNTGCNYTETAVTFSGNTLGDYNGPM